MLDTQWELVYPGTDLVLGSSPLLSASQQRGYHLMSAPEVGDVTLTTEDADNPRRDGITFGQDYRGGQLITFDLGLMGASLDDALALSSDLKRAWRGDAVRNTPGRVATLCTSNLGRLRQVYGRPRRCTTAHTRPRSAFMLGTADFQTVNDLWYDPDPQEIAVTLIPPSSGGLVAPFTVPFTTTSPNTKFGGLTTLGDAPTQPVIQIFGPITNPVVEIPGVWKLALNVVIGLNASITIDCRPWVRTVLASTGGSYAGALARTSKLEKIVLEAETSYTVSFRGIDNTGTSRMTLAWNDAYVSM